MSKTKYFIFNYFSSIFFPKDKLIMRNKSDQYKTPPFTHLFTEKLPINFNR